jgi:hypothetical protein
MVYNLLSVRSSFNKCSPSAFDNFYNATTAFLPPHLYLLDIKNKNTNNIFHDMCFKQGSHNNVGSVMCPIVSISIQLPLPLQLIP